MKMLKLSTLEDLNNFEIKLITCDFADYNIDDIDIPPTCDNSLSQVLHQTVNYIIKGDYNAVLQINFPDYGFSSFKIDPHHPDDFISDFLNDNNDYNRQVNEFILILIGVAALQEFVRCNFCGPQIKVDSYKLISDFFSEISDSEIPSLLSLDGESIYSNAVHPKLLYVSNFILSNVKNSKSLTQKWWLLRCTFLHQAVLPERNESLHHTLVSLISDIQKMDWISDEKVVNKRLVFAVECCHIFLYYGEIVHARKHLVDAQNITGLEIELSGAMGKRTQYQQKPVAQLFVKLERKHLNFSGSVPQKSKFLPSDLHLQDDTLLNKVAFIDSNDQAMENLCAEEQAVLLGYCCLVRKSGSFDELLQEETMSYINCLLFQPQVWPIYVKALIMRCRAEKNSSRHIERAVTQMESIVECIKKAQPPFREREQFFFCTSFPSYWILEKDLADLLLSIGCTKSALDIYERLELWEEIVDCYVRLGRTSCAEKIVREQLQKGENPMLWCLLGDVTENTEYYFKAWELSNHRSARAQRSLGYYYFKRKEYKKSLLHFVSSLEINHLQPEVWFSTGHAATQAEDFELAARAYRQVVMFDEDSFEAWNNLANAYIKTKQKVRAWRSLQEALKCNYNEWRVWENFLLVSTDVGAFEDALRAWHRLLDIKGKHCDSLLLEILVKAVIKDLPDINDCPSSRLKKRTLELLGRVTSITTNDPKVWELYSSLTNSEEVKEKDTLEKAVLFQQKAIRYYNQKQSWERDFDLCKEVLTAAQKMAELYLAYIKLVDEGAKNQQKTSARLNLQSVISRAKKFVEFPEAEKNELNEMLDSLQKSLNEILNL